MDGRHLHVRCVLVPFPLCRETQLRGEVFREEVSAKSLHPEKVRPAHPARFVEVIVVGLPRNATSQLALVVKPARAGNAGENEVRNKISDIKKVQKSTIVNIYTKKTKLIITLT